MLCPNLSDLIKYQAQAQQLQHLRKKVNPTSLSGNLLSKVKGQGLDFLQVRKYYAGDDIKNIDWKVSARTGITHVKEFHIDKTSKISIIANVGADMQFASFGKFKYLLSCELIALLCFASEQNKEPMQAYFYGEHLKKPILFKQKNHVTSQILKFLSSKRTLQTINQDNNLFNTVKEFNITNKDHGVVFILCDFNQLISDPTIKNDYIKQIIFELKRLNRRNKVYLCHIYDQAETSLANLGELNFCDYNNKKFTIDSSNKKFIAAYQKNYQNKLQILQDLTKEKNIKLINIRTDQEPLKKLLEGL